MTEVLGGQRLPLYTSDLHLGHVNIIGYENRPFDSVEEMNAGIIDRWNTQVDDEDDVVILGDFAMGHIAETLPLAAQLRGRKWLLCGNHDRPWAGHGKKAQGWRDRYLEAGFFEVGDGGTGLRYFYPIGERVNIQGDHFPYESIDRHGDRFTGWMPPDRGEWLLHGHVHSAWRQRGRQLNVGFDAWGGHLVTAAELSELVRQGPQNLDAIPW
jgi:calcineurin-like phosphoesterase family protein